MCVLGGKDKHSCRGCVSLEAKLEACQCGDDARSLFLLSLSLRVDESPLPKVAVSKVRAKVVSFVPKGLRSPSEAQAYFRIAVRAPSGNRRTNTKEDANFITGIPKLVLSRARDTDGYGMGCLRRDGVGAFVTT